MTPKSYSHLENLDLLPNLEQGLPHTISSDEWSDISSRTDHGALGPRIIVHSQIRLNSPARLWLTIVGATWFIVLAWGGIQYVYGQQIHGLAAALTWSRPILMFGGFLLVFWLTSVWFILSNRKGLAIHQRGLVLMKPGHKAIQVNWHEVAGIRYAQEETRLLAGKITRYTAILHPNRGRPIHLERYCPQVRLPEFVTIIKSQLYPLLEPELRHDLKIGKTLFFGNLGISVEGILWQNRFIPWSQVNRLDIQSGYLRVSLKEIHDHPGGLPILHVAIKYILNIELFLPIARLATELFYLASQKNKEIPKNR